MLIGFIGCPCSGKTTTAAMTFADLKLMGISTEFIPEQARHYIATKRCDQWFSDHVTLTDEDQLEIMRQQSGMEDVMTASKGAVVVTDSSVFNTLLYLSEAKLAHDDVQWLIEAALERYDLLFYCAPVKMLPTLDPNRIHSEEQSLELDKKIPALLKRFAPDLKPIFLLGDAKERHHVVTKSILEKLAE